MSRKSPKLFSGERKRVFLFTENVQIYPFGFFWRTPEELISASFRLKIGHFETSTTETDHSTCIIFLEIFLENKRLLTRTISSASFSANTTCRQEMKKKQQQTNKKKTIFHLLLGNFNVRYFLTLHNI